MKYYEEFYPNKGAWRLGFIKTESGFTFDISSNLAHLSREETVRLVASLSEQLKNTSGETTKSQSGNVIYLQRKT